MITFIISNLVFDELYGVFITWSAAIIPVTIAYYFMDLRGDFFTTIAYISIMIDAVSGWAVICGLKMFFFSPQEYSNFNFIRSF